jgi:Ca-activated chloride channel homolog
MSSPDPSTPGLDVRAIWEKPVVPAAGGEARLVVQVRAHHPDSGGSRRAPVDVAFVLDRSGSMTGDKLALVKEAVDVAAGHLRDEDRAALVVYDHTVDTLQPLQPATPRAKTALRLALHGVDAGGSTDLGTGWLTGCGELSRAMAEDGAGGPLRLRRSLLLTDGLANVGITEPGELIGHAHELRKRGVGTSTLGVGLDFDEALLDGMAEAGGGNFQFIAEAGQLRAFFERELKELLTIAAAGLTLTLTLPHGVRATLVNRVPAERNGKRIEVAIGDFPADDALDLVFALRVAPGTPGAEHRLDLALAWSDPAADARRGLSPEVAPLVLADEATVEATAPDPVAAEAAALQCATAERREALRLDRAGRHAESRARMRGAVALLQAAPMSAAVADDLAFTQQYASAAPDAAYGEYDRKAGAFYNARRTRGKRDATFDRDR